MHQGSKWIECDKAGQAECPFCGLKGWFVGRKWGGCKHAVGPGHTGKSIETPAAMIYNIDPDAVRRELARSAAKETERCELK